MSSTLEFSVRRVEWGATRDQLRAIRTAVFIDEQKVPIDLEWDGLDPHCLHVLAMSAAGEAIGTGRLLPDGHIGRMAVLKAWRGRGVGSMLLQELVAVARQRGLAGVALNAQTHALDFYARFGFEVIGGEFMDAGIPHRTMCLALISPQ